MTPEEKSTEQTAIMTTWLAGVMGYVEEREEVHGAELIPQLDGGHTTVRNGAKWWINKETGKEIKQCHFRPTEILEQVLDGLKLKGGSIMLEANTVSGGWNIDLYPSKTTKVIFCRLDTYAEIARKIVETLYEERKEK